MSQPLERPRRGRPPRVQVEARRESLIQQAVRHFSEYGYRETTMEGLAASVGMSKTTLYRQYGSKSGLVLAAAKAAVPLLSDELERVPTGRSRSPQAVLLDFGRIIRAHHMSPQIVALWRAVSEARDELRKFPHLIPELQTAALAPIAAYLGQLKDRGLVDIDDPASGASCFSAIIGGGLSAFLGDPVADPELLPPAEFCVRLFLHGVGAKPA